MTITSLCVGTVEMHISEREIVTDDDLKNAFLTSEEQVITSKSSQLTVTNQFWNISTDAKDSPCKRVRSASRWWEHHGWKSVTSLLVSTLLEQSGEHALS